MATYKVESVQTGHYIISVQGGGEHHGDVVSSSNMAYPISMYAVRALRRLSFAIVDNISYPRIWYSAPLLKGLSR